MVSGLVRNQPLGGDDTITRSKRNDETFNLTKQELLRVLNEDDALKKLLQTLLQEVLEAQMDEALFAGKGDLTGGRLGYRSGHHTRSLITPVGNIMQKGRFVLFLPSETPSPH
jgi:Transposase, Mutator family